MHASIDQYSASARAREAQLRWAAQSIAERLQVIRGLRNLIAAEAESLAQETAAVSGRSVAEKLASEVLPLADACRWLEKNAARVLAPHRVGRGQRPFWLHGVSSQIQRQPVGLVLVIGPGNYPLFLPAIHSLQALVAGNAVLLKPAPGTRAVAQSFARLAQIAGLGSNLLTVLPESVKAADDAISKGVDKVIFTGSSENGREVLQKLAATNTPAVMELSGDDAVVVFADADLDLVARALDFGMRLNGGETCIAPRRIIAQNSIADELLSRIGYRQVEVFANEEEALGLVHASRFALGASIFSSDLRAVRALASRIKTGFVLINDLIVPTADPRLPFGGVHASGFGSTRGAEGLLEMTFPHVVTLRRSNSHRHFDEAAGPRDVRLFSSYIRAVHGRGSVRFGAARDLLLALIAKVKNERTNS